MPEFPTLKQSVAYQWRLPLTILALILGWTGSLFSQPWIAQNSGADRWFGGGGWLLLSVGIAVRGWASCEISGRKRQIVVDTGPYALCRNPLYWGTFFLGVSQLLFLRSLSFLLAFSVPLCVYVLWVIPAEEQYLASVLGDPYLAYCREVPRWVPRWNPKVWISLGPTDPEAYRREEISLAGCLALPFIAELICFYRETPGWPHWPIPYL